MPPSDPVCRAEKSPRSITVRRGWDLPTTTRRPHASSVQTNSTSEEVSASQTISWAAIGEAGQLAAMIHLSLGCQRCLPSQPDTIRAPYKIVITTLRMSRTSLKFRDDGADPALLIFRTGLVICARPLDSPVPLVEANSPPKPGRTTVPARRRPRLDRAGPGDNDDPPDSALRKAGTADSDGVARSA